MKQVINTQAAHHHAVAKAERIHGVIGAYWNPRTHEMTIRYDARVSRDDHPLRCPRNISPSYHDLVA